MATYDLYSMFLKQVERAEPYLGANAELLPLFREPREVTEYTLPLRMSDGSLELVKAWRSHHNNALGPYKGGSGSTGTPPGRRSWPSPPG